MGLPDQVIKIVMICKAILMGLSIMLLRWTDRWMDKQNYDHTCCSSTQCAASKNQPWIYWRQIHKRVQCSWLYSYIRSHSHHQCRHHRAGMAEIYIHLCSL